MHCRASQRQRSLLRLGVLGHRVQRLRSREGLAVSLFGRALLTCLLLLAALRRSHWPRDYSANDQCKGERRG